MTLENRIFNPPEGSLHFDSSLRLTEKILKVRASWRQQISTLDSLVCFSGPGNTSELISKFGNEIRKGKGNGPRD